VILFSIFYKPQVNYTHHLREIAAAATGPDGSFAIPGFNVDDLHFGTAGKTFLTVSCPGFATLAAAYLEALTPGRENDLGDVALLTGGTTVRGTVFDSRGIPVAGALVAFTGEIYPTEYSKDQRYAFLPRFPHAVTGPDGTFEAEGIAGRHWISVHVGPDCVTSQLRDFPSSGEQAGLVFRVLAGGRVDGKVVDAQDRPVADAVVSGGQNSTHSYADGSFVLENVEGGVLNLEVRHHLFRTVSVENVPVGQAGLKILLADPLPKIVFLVLRADTREPVTTVRIGFSGGGGFGAPAASRDAGGRFAMVIPEYASKAGIWAEGTGIVEVPLSAARDGEEIEVLLHAEEGK
jgi:hypothetical protein